MSSYLSLLVLILLQQYLCTSSFAQSLRVNVGGPAIPAIGFLSDSLFLTSTQTIPRSVPPQTVPLRGNWQPVYDHYRYAFASSDLAFAIPVPDGTYEIALLFAETFRGTAKVNARVFSLSFNNLFNRNIDVFKSVGFNAPLYLRFKNIRPVSNVITIRLNRIPGRENPMLSAFVITGPGVTDLIGKPVPPSTLTNQPSPIPVVPDPTCATGIIGSNQKTRKAACCKTICGRCGGSKCGTFASGESCCIGKINDAGRLCTQFPPPCILPFATPLPPPNTLASPPVSPPISPPASPPASPSASPPASSTSPPEIPDPKCSTGILGSDGNGKSACCVAACRQCGGVGCAEFSPGDLCCVSLVLTQNRSCNKFPPPCVPIEAQLPSTKAPPTQPTAPPPAVVSCAVSGATPTSFRMNVAAGAIAAAEMGADNVAYITSSNEGLISTTDSVISSDTGSKPWDAAFASHRWTQASVLTYKIPVPLGSYTVSLLFAETFFSSPNRRLFDIFINGVTKRKNLDVFKLVGKDVGLTLTFDEVSSNSGSITITLIKTKENPMISGILIEGPGAGNQAVGGGCATGDNQNGSSDLNGGFNHRSHSVPGGPYIATDFDKDGRALVSLDGTQSHSHYSDPGPPEVSGTIVSYKWTWKEVIDGKTVKRFNNNKSGKFETTFPIGKTTITLEVVDSTGDVAKDTAMVEVRASTANGAYCYSYDFGKKVYGHVPISQDLDSEPKPLFGGRTDRINFMSANDFGNFNFAQNSYAVRCVFFFDVPANDTYQFTVQHSGPFKLLLSDGVVAQSNVKGVTQTGDLGLSEGLASFQLLYFRPNDVAPLLVLSIDGTPLSPSQLQHDISATLPVIRDLSKSTSTPAGGSNIQIFGSAFINGVSVRFGDLEASNLVRSGPNNVQVTVPEGYGVVNVTVSTNAGVSNAVPFTYTSGTTLNQPVIFRQTSLKDENGDDYKISFIAAAVYGPDGRLYLGSTASRVHALGIDREYKVTSTCTRKIGSRRAVLGVAFSPFSNKLRLYFTSSTLYWKDKNLFSFEEGWPNGKVETIEFSNEFVVDNEEAGHSCAGNQQVLVSGLPVSNHDHAVNKLQFLPDGRLLIGVGGFTNGGVSVPGKKPVPNDPEDDALGGVGSNPLSAAIVACPARKVTNIVYENYDDPENARVISGGACNVYASGFRNTFGMTLHTNGHLYALDNGPNAGFGDFATDCDGNTVPGQNIPDKLFRVEEGMYHGHPNMNRRECLYYPESAVQPIFSRVRSSTNGIIEYRSNTFGGEIKENLYMSRFAIQNSGLIAQAKLGPDGKLLPNGGYASNFISSSGLSLVEGPRGELVMPRVYQSEIIVNFPVYPAPDVTFMLGVHPKQGPSFGGTRVLITGHNFGTEPSAVFGNKPCGNVVTIDDESFTCVTPANSNNLQVAVIVTGKSGDSPSYGSDFWYF